MRYIIPLLSLLSCLASAQKVSVKNVLEKLPTSIRGLSVVDDRVVWFSGSKGHVGRSIDGGASWKVQSVKDFEAVDFRSLYAFDSLNAIIANAGSPASILKTVDGGKTWKEVYHNEHKDIFLDGIDFWDSQRGLIYGDPINSHMQILKTSDGGNTWHEITHARKPILVEGEASFAASGTGIRCYDQANVAIATGGTASRIWLSHDAGEHWHPIETPIVQGKSSAGVFSIAQNSKKWMIVGGDFEVDTLSQFAAFSSNKTTFNWQAPNTPTGGYRSCVEYLSGKTWVAVGSAGADISTNNGKTWTAIVEKGLHVVRRARKGGKIFAAGNGRVVTLSLGR